jgi:hypothetical protein
MVLFWMTSVFAFVLGVQAFGFGLLDGDELLPPHAATIAIPAATTMPPVRVPHLRMHTPPQALLS